MAQAQADADFGIAGAIAGATAGKAAAAAGSMFTAAVSKAAGDLTRALNAVQTGFVDAATAASVKATKAIAAAETVERKAVAKANVVLTQDLQAAWGTYASAECGAVILNARERATISADYKKDVAGAELAAVKAVAPARKTSMIAAADANGVYHVKVTGIIADLGILGGQIHVEQVKASQSLISPTTLKKWLDSLSGWGDIAAAFSKGLAQGVANLGNAAQDVGVGFLNVPAASVNFGSWASEKLFFDVPDHMKIRIPYIPSPDWSKGMVTPESDFDHNVSKGCLEVAIGVFGTGAVGRLGRAAVVADDAAVAGRSLLPQRGGFGAKGFYSAPTGMADDAVKAAYLQEANSLAFRVKLTLHNLLTPFHKKTTLAAVREAIEGGAFGRGAFTVKRLDDGRLLFGGSSTQTFLNRQFFHHELIHVSQMIKNPKLWTEFPLRMLHEPIQIWTAHGTWGIPTTIFAGWFVFESTDGD
jgi:hypothetical protein